MVASKEPLTLLLRPDVPLPNLPLLAQQLFGLVSDLLVEGDEEAIIDVNHKNSHNPIVLVVDVDSLLVVRFNCRETNIDDHDLESAGPEVAGKRVPIKSFVHSKPRFPRKIPLPPRDLLQSVQEHLVLDADVVLLVVQRSLQVSRSHVERNDYRNGQIKPFRRGDHGPRERHADLERGRRTKPCDVNTGVVLLVDGVTLCVPNTMAAIHHTHPGLM